MSNDSRDYVELYYHPQSIDHSELRTHLNSQDPRKFLQNDNIYVCVI
jgi:hypothetical protein